MAYVNKKIALLLGSPYLSRGTSDNFFMGAANKGTATTW
jgi:hypothetical protein